MVTTFTPTLIYVGNFPIADTDETNFTAENDPFNSTVVDENTLELVTVTAIDNNDNNVIQDDEFGLDSVTYDIGSGSVTTYTDSTLVYTAAVTLADGTVTNIDVVMMQMQNGDTFISDLSNGGTLDNLEIQKVEFLSQISSNYAGWFASQDTSGTTIVCFARGTMILTDDGERAVESLRIGDRVMTLDNGVQEIRWIGSRTVGGAELARNEKLFPIRIKAGSLGETMPKSDLIVSRQHRILARSNIAQKMFGLREILLPAHKLLAIDGVENVRDIDGIQYWHIMFDEHQVIFANGAPAESLLPGPQALKALSPEAQEEIRTLFPEHLNEDQPVFTAYPVPSKGREIDRFVFRHVKNGKNLVDFTDNHTL